MSLLQHVQDAIDKANPRLTKLCDALAIVTELERFGVMEPADLASLSPSLLGLLCDRVPSAPPLLLSSLLPAQDVTAGAGSGRSDDALAAKPLTTTVGVSRKPGNPWKILTRLVDLNQLSDIDSKLHCFTASITVEMVVIDAADDPAMSAPGVVAPAPPSTLPSAGWYLDRLSPINGKEVQIIDWGVRRQGKDLMMFKSLRGTFYESMELQTFPFDGQGLTITLAFLNRQGGPFGVDLGVASDLKQGIDFFGFNLHGSYMLREFLLVGTHEVSIESVDANHIGALASLGSTSGLSVNSSTSRQHHAARIKAAEAAAASGGASVVETKPYQKIFAAVSIEAYVVRKPRYYLFSMSVPLAAITTLAFVQFAYPTDFSDRVPLTVTLLLTAAAYANVIKGSLPELGYLTLQDKYLLCSSGTLFLCAIETPLVMIATGGYRDSGGKKSGGFLGDDDDEGLDGASAGAWCVDSRGRNCELDMTLFAALGLLWVGANIYFMWSYWSAWRQSMVYMSSAWLLEQQGKASAFKELAHAEVTRQASTKAGRKSESRTSLQDVVGKAVTASKATRAAKGEDGPQFLSKRKSHKLGGILSAESSTATKAAQAEPITPAALPAPGAAAGTAASVVAS